MADIFDIYDKERANIGGIPISPQQRAQLHAGVTITITYHTPRMLHKSLGSRNGEFQVAEIDGRLIATNAEQVKQYILLQADIARAMKELKWVDPDAESDSPIR